MKKRKKLLIALNAALATVLSALPNFISSNFPFIPVLTLWIIAGVIFIVSMVISVIVSFLEDEKEEVQAALQTSSVSQKATYTPTPLARSKAKSKTPQPIRVSSQNNPSLYG